MYKNKIKLCKLLIVLCNFTNYSFGATAAQLKYASIGILKAFAQEAEKDRTTGKGESLFSTIYNTLKGPAWTVSLFGLEKINHAATLAGDGSTAIAPLINSTSTQLAAPAGKLVEAKLIAVLGGILAGGAAATVGHVILAGMSLCWLTYKWWNFGKSTWEALKSYTLKENGEIDIVYPTGTSETVPVNELSGKMIGVMDTKQDMSIVLQIPDLRWKTEDALLVDDVIIHDKSKTVTNMGQNCAHMVNLITAIIDNVQVTTPSEKALFSNQLLSHYTESIVRVFDFYVKIDADQQVLNRMKSRAQQGTISSTISSTIQWCKSWYEYFGKVQAQATRTAAAIGSEALTELQSALKDLKLPDITTLSMQAKLFQETEEYLNKSDNVFENLKSFYTDRAAYELTDFVSGVLHKTYRQALEKYQTQNTELSKKGAFEIPEWDKETSCNYINTFIEQFLAKYNIEGTGGNTSFCATLIPYYGYILPDANFKLTEETAIRFPGSVMNSMRAIINPKAKTEKEKIYFLAPGIDYAYVHGDSAKVQYNFIALGIMARNAGVDQTVACEKLRKVLMNNLADQNKLGEYKQYVDKMVEVFKQGFSIIISI